MSGAAAALGHHRLTLENVSLRKQTPATWADSVANWEQYVEDKEDQSMVFVGDDRENDGEIITAPYSHRFRQEYTKMQYAKIQGFVNGALKEYDDPHLVFLTFSSSTTTATGDYRPPLDHMDEVVNAWGDGVYYELNRVMAGDRKSDSWAPREEWEYLYILEPTTDEGSVPGGYAHAHAALVVDGEVDSHRFESVITRHLTECPNATGDAHEFDDAIEVKKADELGNPGAYLFKYLGKSWDSEALEDYERRFAALLKEEGRQRFRASNGAQRWMQLEEDESSDQDWRFGGVLENDRLDKLLEYEDAHELCDDQEVREVREWVSGVTSLSGETAEKGGEYDVRPLAPMEYEGVDVQPVMAESGDEVLLWEVQEEEPPDPPPQVVMQTRAKADLLTEPPSGNAGGGADRPPNETVGEAREGQDHTLSDNQ